MNRGIVIVANAMRDFVHDKSHTVLSSVRPKGMEGNSSCCSRMTQKQADTKETNGCWSKGSDKTSESMAKEKGGGKKGRRVDNYDLEIGA
jgi:hypothetical protein